MRNNPVNDSDPSGTQPRINPRIIDASDELYKKTRKYAIKNSISEAQKAQERLLKLIEDLGAYSKALHSKYGPPKGFPAKLQRQLETDEGLKTYYEIIPKAYNDYLRKLIHLERVKVSIVNSSSRFGLSNDIIAEFEAAEDFPLKIGSTDLYNSTKSNLRTEFTRARAYSRKAIQKYSEKISGTATIGEGIATGINVAEIGIGVATGTLILKHQGKKALLKALTTVIAAGAVDRLIIDPFLQKLCSKYNINYHLLRIGITTFEVLGLLRLAELKTRNKQNDVDPFDKQTGLTNNPDASKGPLKNRMGDPEEAAGRSRTDSVYGKPNAPRSAAKVTAPIDFDGHILNAEVKASGKVVGGHSTATGQVKVIQGTASGPNANGVYKAKIEVADPNNPGQFLPKTNNGGWSTMFPDSWSADRVKIEVDAAFKNKTVNGNKWSGTTPSGVRVEGYLHPKTTVYPIY